MPAQELHSYELPKLKAGMLLGKSVLDLRGRILLSEGTVLSDPLIDRLFRLGVEDVMIQEEASVTLEGSVTLEAAKVESLHKAAKVIKDAFKAIEHYDKVPVKVFENVAKSDLIPIVNGPASLNYLTLDHPAPEYLFNHSMNVGLLSGAIGKWLGYEEKAISDLIMAGLLHDIGKAKIPAELVNKPGKLSEAEMKVMRLHATYSYSMIASLPGISKEAAFAVLQHHERLDGSGYPGHFTADKIHPYSRIVAIADTYDAMISNRLYSEKVTPFAAAEHLSKNMYGKFDIEICSTFLNEFGQSISGNMVKLTDGSEGQLIITGPFVTAKPILHRLDGQFVTLPDFKSIAEIMPYPISS
ncbi:MAG: HD-GYP domain-containing protein [Sporomusaceae bacterium]|nr:HD-GYP domain-containing protein [Sporomusaceae bacterium]